MKDPRDHSLVTTLLSKADVFVQNLAPGAAKRAGFDSTELKKKFPQLITLDVSGYGESEDYSKYKAYDLLVAAEAGLCSITGSKESPGRVGVSICDIVCGLNGYAAILKALLARGRNQGLPGTTPALKVSLFSAVAELMTVPLLHQQHQGSPPQRSGLSHPSIAPYGAFPTKDQDLVLISIQNEREWVNLCAEVLKQPEISTDPLYSNPASRVQNREQLDWIIAEAFGKHDTEAVKKLLTEAKIAFGQVKTLQNVLDHPALTMSRAFNEDGNEVKVVAPAISFDDSDLNRSDSEMAQMKNRVPRLGQHTEAIRAEFGY